MSAMRQTKLFAILLTLISASFLAACSQTGSASDGAGFERLKPNSGTRTYISQNDDAFRDQVAGHNLQCRKDKGCRK